jgi:hypothetical protein
LALLRRTAGILFATMSGSGATCVGLTRDMAAARNAARAIQLGRPRWWVAPAPLLTGAPDPGRLLVQAGGAPRQAAQTSRATT